MLTIRSVVKWLLLEFYVMIIDRKGVLGYGTLVKNNYKILIFLKKMKIHIPQIFKQYVLQFADLYHNYRVETDRLQKCKYRICSTIAYYKRTNMIQLSYNDKPGDLLPPMSINQIKNTHDILMGLHPIDVNSINDLYYLSQDTISNIIVTDNKIKVVNQNGQLTEYDINENFEDNNLISKRISFLIGYMQAEKLLQEAYSVEQEKFKIIRDNITTLEILNVITNEELLKNPSDILFSEDYKYFCKKDVLRIGYICGQMINI